MDLLHSLMPGETDMAVRMRGNDWSGTELGEPARWPASLRCAVRACLTSRLPIFVGWGREFSLVYNDGCIPLLGTGRHPGALGRPARASFPDQWDRLRPLLEALVTTGEGQPPHLLLLEQSVNLCCSPILAEDGVTVQGVFCPCTAPVDHSEERQASEAQFRRRVGSLSPRELEVMCRVVRGMLNKQIAAELKIAEVTVKVHRRRVMEKTGAQSLAELVRLAERVDLGFT
jgi:DNA-binding CsgD family transcriptional regulator